MNATTQSALNARYPQYAPSRTPRMIAAVAAVVVTIALFDGVALLGGNSGAVSYEAGSVVAQNISEAVAR